MYDGMNKRGSIVAGRLAGSKGIRKGREGNGDTATNID